MIAFLLATIFGVPLALRLYRGASWGALLGTAFLLGAGIVTLFLFAASIVHVPWSLPLAVIAPTLVLVATSWRLRWVPPRIDRFTIVDVVTAVFLGAYARFATIAPAWENDFLAIWGLKGRTFFLARAVEVPVHAWSHPDYPPLVPLVYDYASFFTGHWDDRGASIVYAFFAAAALLVVRSVLEEETGSRYGASFGALILASLVATPWIGMADGPLIAYALTGITLLRSGRTTLGATLLGLAAFTKNEGLTLVAAAAIALAVEQGVRALLRLWPAIAIPLPWLAYRAVHGLATDLASGPISARIAAHLAHPGAYAVLITKSGIRPLLLTGLAAAFVLGWRRRPIRLLLLVVALQCAAYLAAYLVTPLDITFHIATSWTRLLWHLMPIVTFAALVSVLPLTGSALSSSRLSSSRAQTRDEL